jgi:hypothetical protein
MVIFVSIVFFLYIFKIVQVGDFPQLELIFHKEKILFHKIPITRLRIHRLKVCNWETITSERHRLYLHPVQFQLGHYLQQKVQLVLVMFWEYLSLAHIDLQPDSRTQEFQLVLEYVHCHFLLYLNVLVVVYPLGNHQFLTGSNIKMAPIIY